jgi:23S rRNA (uracil1939-C5)-methyltransferase
MSSSSRVVSLPITAFSKNGKGKGEWITDQGNSITVEVPFSMPQDEVWVQIGKKRKGVNQGQVLDWTNFSENRVVPRCVHFEKCGGCLWQHVPYTLQAEQKQNWIHDLFRPFVQESASFYPMVLCESPWEYRNKMELSFSSDKTGNRYLGLILHQSRGHVFQMEECHLMNHWIVDAVEAVSGWWSKSELRAYHLGSNQGALRTLTLREGQRSGDRMVMLTVSGNPDYALTATQIRDFVTILRDNITPTQEESQLSIFIRIQQIAKGKPTQFFEMHLFGPSTIRETLIIEMRGMPHSFTFKISPTAFFQPNSRQAEKLYAKAIALAQLSSDAIVFDLYCGTGTLGICAAKYAKKVVGIELCLEAALDAKENAQLNGIENLTIRTGDVGKVLSTVLEEEGNPDVVFVDPPRAGLDSAALRDVLKANANRIVYISCNPKTQAENVQVLVCGGYCVETVQPVDQFPQTIHTENIVVLQRVVNG